MNARQHPLVRWSLALLLLAGLALPAAPVRAQGEADAADQRVTLTLREVPLRAALNTMLGGTGIQYIVEPNVPDVLITLNIADIRVQDALRTVVRVASTQAPGLTVAREGSVFLIRMRPPAPPLVVRDEAPPEYQPDAGGELVWEKIPIQFTHVGILTMAFGGMLLPNEGQMLGMGMPFGGMGMGMGGMGRGMMPFGGMGMGMGGLGGMGMGMGGLGGWGGMGGFGRPIF